MDVAASRQHASESYYPEIEHYLYIGDTALHVAGAAYRASMVGEFVRLGADVDARNHRGAQPLHYAADGLRGSPAWNPTAQRDTITALIEAGADPDATDTSGLTPLHRAVRTRCAEAVSTLLAGGADPGHPNKRGSTPLLLATQSTGRGGSGSAEAKVQQERIIIHLLATAFGERPSP